MVSSRFTPEHDELLLSVAGRHGTWPERVQAFTDELHKRSDFLPMPEPAFTLLEIRNHLNELCEIVPIGLVKSLSSGWYPKRTELLQTIDNNTVGESNEVKTVLFNHAVKKKGWSFIATLEQVKWKLGRLPRNNQHTGTASVPALSTSSRQSSGMKRPSTNSTGTWIKSKRQHVENDATTESDKPATNTILPVVDHVENDSCLVDNGFEGECIVTESDGSDIERTEGDGAPGVSRGEPVPSPESGNGAGTAKAHGHQRGEINVCRDVRTEVEQTRIDNQNEAEETMTAHLRSLVNNKLMSDVLFVALIDYVYTDQVNVSSDNVELFVAADRFGIESLKQQCSKKLVDSLCVDNAANTLLAAIQHHDPVLRDACFTFTLRNLEKVSKTKSFHEMARRDPEMVVKIVQKVSSLVHIS
ncbi:BTB/POZ and MATH domain-containing protein 2 [Phytophthora nicotianae]|uniref:BTB/POZ and MATH domain-containing protein 2 n=1 Tax=Phytophthora nicotianae TaxID=4792 RepID=A0A0W8BXQ7_PHYNI|nr:BTB/POZ and MATH domain-containing protein 2 [Phytophthora nicotianae]